ncbi:MAG: DUF4160 domain-containing protein [Leptospiraceae bacterium]|nr:DUF4160 domain-containing protein [Leptospiraceae bacterium]
MPVISEFFGIKVMMFWADHAPPHFHAQYGEFKVLVAIEYATVLQGVFPARQLKILLAWCEMRRSELMENWAAAREHREIKSIAPIH